MARADQHQFTCDRLGQHQMLPTQALDLEAHQRFLTSGGMGAMDFVLAAPIGVSLAAALVVVIADDGGFQLNIQELQAIKRNQLPVKIVVLNNRCHGMVRQFSESYLTGRYQSTLWGYDAPDFVQVALAYKIEARRFLTPDKIKMGLTFLSRDTTELFLLEIELDTMANAYPKLAFGCTFGEMEPMAKPLEME